MMIFSTFGLSVVNGEHVDGHELQQTEVPHGWWGVRHKCREQVQHLTAHLRETLHSERFDANSLRH